MAFLSSSIGCLLLIGRVKDALCIPRANGATSLDDQFDDDFIVVGTGIISLKSFLKVTLPSFDITSDYITRSALLD